MNQFIFDPKDTVVLADFDGTFTKKEVLGKKTSSLMTVLVNEKYLGKEGTKACQDLFSHYYPIETDPHLALDKKKVLMQEWWQKTFQALHQAGLTREMLFEVCDSPLLQWREQLLDFLRYLQAKNIPLVVFSAGGFGDLAIKHLLAKENLLTSNVQILSNQMLFDEQGFFTGEVVQPIIHIAN